MSRQNLCAVERWFNPPFGEFAKSVNLWRSLRFWPNFGFRVAGVTFDGRQETIRELLWEASKSVMEQGYVDSDVEAVSAWAQGTDMGGFGWTAPYMNIRLRPEPDNEYDKHAVAIDACVSGDWKPVGYVPRVSCYSCGGSTVYLGMECKTCLWKKSVIYTNQVVGKALSSGHVQEQRIELAAKTDDGSVGLRIALLIGPREWATHWMEFWEAYFGSAAAAVSGEHDGRSKDEWDRRMQTIAERLNNSTNPVEELVHATANRAEEGAQEAGKRDSS